jgi:phage tail sheath protein FI
MPTYRAPGIYVEERSTGARPIPGVATSTAAFIGVTERGPVGQARLITNLAEFVKVFGGPLRLAVGVQEHYLFYAVQHFFDQGGTRCYVARVVHFGNVNNPATIAAHPAARQFPAQRLDGTAVPNALRVEALSPGIWGQSLGVEIRNSSRFQLLLHGDIAAGNATAVNLRQNSEVRVGSILHLVHEVAGIVESVDAATLAITFAGGLTEGTGMFAGNIADNDVVFVPDLSLRTTTDLAAAVAVAAGVAPVGLILTSVTKFDGTLLGPGDLLHFVREEALVVVQSIETTMVGTTVAMRAVVADAATPVALPALPEAGTRVYASDFTITVRDQATGDVLETHPNLSLADANAADHVNIRLSRESGASQFIVASDLAAADDILMQPSAFVPLTGAATDDGLADLSVADLVGSELFQTGLHAFDANEDISILSVPPSRLSNAGEPDPLVNQLTLTSQVIAWVDARRDLFYVIDPPPTGGDPINEVRTFRQNFSSAYAGIYFPWILVRERDTGRLIQTPLSGAIAGIFARTDSRRGVHKAPAGTDVGRVTVASGLTHQISTEAYDILYPDHVNAIRAFPREGFVVWGSRTISADPLWRQVSIRRLFLFLEKSIEQGTAWAAFEPNDPTLWKALERSVKAFLRIQWIDGRLVGPTEKEAFFVRCNAETNPPEVVDAGQVVTEIGVAPSRPAEFVIFRIRQFAGRVA